jgi:hypothetical protein
MRRLGSVEQPLRILDAPIVAAVTDIACECHAKAFITGFIYLLPVMLIALSSGFIEATVASEPAVGCFDYFFTERLFLLYPPNPQAWAAISIFETIASTGPRWLICNQSDSPGAQCECLCGSDPEWSPHLSLLRRTYLWET